MVKVKSKSGLIFKKENGYYYYNGIRLTRGDIEAISKVISVFGYSEVDAIKKEEPKPAPLNKLWIG